MKLMHKWVLILLLLFVAGSVSNIRSAKAAQDCTAERNGYWDAPATWGVASMQSCDGVFTIPSGLTVAVRARTTVQIPQSCGYANVVVAGKLINEGSFVLGCDAGTSENMDLRVESFGVIENKSTMLLYSPGDTKIWGQIQNFGTLTVAGAHTLINNGTLVNKTAAHFINGQQVENYGTLENFGTLTNTDFVLNNGTFINHNDAQIDSTYILRNDANFQNDGIIDNTFILVNYSSFTNTGTIYSSYQLNNWGGTLNNSGSIYSNGTISNQVFSPQPLLIGTMINQSSGTIVASGQFQNGGIVENYGVLNSDSFSNHSAGYSHATVVNHETGQLTTTNSFTNDDEFTNKGTLTNEGQLTNTAVMINTGDILNKLGAILLNEVNGTFHNYDQIVNLGVMINHSVLANKCGGSITGNPVVGVPVIQEGCSVAPN